MRRRPRSRPPGRRVVPATALTFRRAAMLQPDARSASLDWMSGGACQREDPELFFPIAMTGPALRQVNVAKAICQRCAVRVACLSYGLKTSQDRICGGTTTE